MSKEREREERNNIINNKSEREKVEHEFRLHTRWHVLLVSAKSSLYNMKRRSGPANKWSIDQTLRDHAGIHALNKMRNGYKMVAY